MGFRFYLAVKLGDVFNDELEDVGVAVDFDFDDFVSARFELGFEVLHVL